MRHSHRVSICNVEVTLLGPKLAALCPGWRPSPRAGGPLQGMLEHLRKITAFAKARHGGLFNLEPLENKSCIMPLATLLLCLLFASN